MRTRNEQYIIDKNGEKSAVILPIDEYHELLEDIHDLAVIAERRDSGSISLAEMKQRIK